MKLRSIGAFLIVASITCWVMAFDFYYRDVATAKEIAELLDGIEFESVQIRFESKVAGICGVVFAVAGIRCWFEFLRQKRKNAVQTGLLADSKTNP